LPEGGPPPTVVVVGGGIAGLSVAYFLRRGGAEVTVLESNRIGRGASGVNAGWVSPAQAGPLPGPGLTKYGLRSLVSRDSALYFSPAYLPSMLPWLARFGRRCNARDYRRGLAALAVLGQRAFALTERLVDDGVEFALHRRGMLIATGDRAAAAGFLASMEPLRTAGLSLTRDVLDGAAARELEPALTDRVTAGVLIEDLWHVDPPTLIDGLARRLRAMGVTLEEGAEVQELIARDGRVREVHSTAGTYAPDVVVLAAGAQSPQLTRRLPLCLPIQPGKGYSFELELDHPPQRALLLLEPHVACTPFADRVRIAGTMEFSGLNARIDHRRIDTMVREAGTLLQLPDTLVPRRVQSGLRPIAPDGLPIIDRAPEHDNLFLATAYSMLGMTIEAPAAEALATQILTGRRPPELEPFSATRFGGVRRRVAR
jgi:D-amino-acid dehydrogenase